MTKKVKEVEIEVPKPDVTTFQKNEPEQKRPNIDINNQCFRCGIRAGRYQDKRTKVITGIFLLTDSRGFKMCNKCKEQGYLIPKRKLNKSEKRKFKNFKREFTKAKDIPHVTLDKEGNPVK